MSDRAWFWARRPIVSHSPLRSYHRPMEPEIQVFAVLAIIIAVMQLVAWPIGYLSGWH